MHRVVFPDAMVLEQKERNSIAYFTNPDNDFCISGYDRTGKTEKKTVGAHIKMKTEEEIFDVQ